MTPVSLSLLLALASAADLPPALVVCAPGEPSPAPAGVCAKLAAALFARMPAVRVVSGGPASSEDLLVSLAAADAGHWTLAVERGGARALERSMPAAESGPDAAFFVACAAVVDRYLQGLDWKGRPESIDPGAVAEPRPPSPVSPPPEPSIDWTIGVGAAGAAGIEQSSWRIGPAIDLMARRASLLGAVRGLVYVPDRHTITPARPDRTGQTGEIEDLSASAAAMGGVCKGEDVSFCGGLQLGWRGTWAWGTSSELFHWQTAHSDAYLAGLFALLSVRLPARFELRALLTGSGFVGEDGFFVEGAAGPVLLPPRYEVGLSLELARSVP